jgi:hypothetical protein
VSEALAYTTVANVAAIPGSPTNGDALRITNSTSIESFTPLIGVPVGFVGNSALTVEIYYNGTSSTWIWSRYFPIDPESRYWAGSVVVSDTAPLSPTEDSLWYDSIGGRFYIWYNDGNTSQWVDVSPQGNRTSTFLAGTAALPGLTPEGDSNTGIYSPGADQVAISTNGSERLRVDSAGRLLLGTSTARSNFFNGSVSAAFQVEGTNSDTRRVAIISSDTGAAGNGAYLLLARQINGSIGGNQAVTNGDSLGAVSFQGSDGTEFVEGARIEAVADAATSANDVPTRLVLSTTADGASSPTERMRITNVGIVNIGTSGSTLAPSTTSPGITLYPNDYSVFSSAGNEPLTLNRNGDGALLSCRRSGTNVGSISVTTTATAFNTSSDYRLKENVVPLVGAVDRLKQLPVRRFNFIADPGKTVDGFLAHEAQVVVPECVTGEKDGVDEDGNPVYQGIDQSKLVPLLTAALQEAIGRIETLEAQNAQLDARLTALEGGTN